jgi:hypothetical protein
MNKAERIINKIKKSYIAILIGVILFVISSIITISQGVSLMREYYDNSFGYKRKLTDDLYKLAPDTNIAYFEKILGNPVFINEKSDNKKLDEPIQKEFIFINKYYLIQAITGKNDKVLAYSITAESQDDPPVFIFWQGTTDIKINLGMSSFSMLSGEPVRARLNCGARRGSYNEEYYFGNPGYYLTYIFSINDIADTIPSLCDEEFLHGDVGVDYSNDNEIDITNEKIQKFRKESAINTITITSPFTIGKDLLFEPGPNKDQIRLLDRFSHNKNKEE